MSQPREDPSIPDPERTIAAYKRDVDRTLLRENLKLTPEQRVQQLMRFLRFLDELKRSRRGRA